MDVFPSYDHRPPWFYKMKGIVRRVKADSWFTCVFLLKCPSGARGNSAVIKWRLNVHSGKGAFFLISKDFLIQCHYSFHDLAFRHAFLFISVLNTLFSELLHNARVAKPRHAIFDRLVYIKMESNSTRDILIHRIDHHSNIKSMVVLTSLTCKRCLQPADPHFVATFRAKIYQTNAPYL